LNRKRNERKIVLLSVFERLGLWAKLPFGKANVVVDVLSRKSLHMSTLMARVMELIEQFRDPSLVYEVTPSSVKLGMLKITSDVLDEIREGQKSDLKLSII
jgi:hypothetical protein